MSILSATTGMISRALERFAPGLMVPPDSESLSDAFVKQAMPSAFGVPGGDIKQAVVVPATVGRNPRHPEIQTFRVQLGDAKGVPYQQELGVSSEKNLEPGRRVLIKGTLVRRTVGGPEMCASHVQMEAWESIQRAPTNRLASLADRQVLVERSPDKKFARWTQFTGHVSGSHFTIDGDTAPWTLLGRDGEPRAFEAIPPSAFCNVAGCFVLDEDGKASVEFASVLVDTTSLIEEIV